MTLRIIEVSAPAEAADKLEELAEQYNAIDCWHYDSKGWLSNKKDNRETTRILIDVKNQQDLLDALTRAVNKNDGWRIVLIPIEASLPEVPDAEDQENEKQKEEAKEKAANGSAASLIKSRMAIWYDRLKAKDILKGSVTREELQDDMERGARLSLDRILLVFLSSVVAGVGLIQDDVAVIIGAMVIAPLLGPNLALAFGAALGNQKLIKRAAVTNIISISFTLFISAMAALFMDSASIMNSDELMNRTNINYASIALALAAGGAAVLSLTTGVSSALVGVMVAVALLPPAVALGLTIGNAQWNLAAGTALLLSTNIVCINLAALAVFRLKGIKPRTWYEEKRAKAASKTNAIFWISTLILLAIMIWVKNTYFPY